jgi:4-amino-4-deoxy-L-arabinose transferase-like glycosyltransferase
MWSRSAARATDHRVDPATAGLLAGTILVAGYTFSKHIYIARPDMMLSALLTASWILGTLTLDRAARGERGARVHIPALGMWVCVGAALLTKGPPALIVPVYVLLASRLVWGQWGLVHATGWWWGLPLALGMFGGWIVPVAVAHPEHVREVLIGEEIVDRVSGGGVPGVVLGLWKMPGYVLVRWLPWSVLMIAALVQIGPRRWFRHPLGPAILWAMVVLVIFSATSARLARYLLPLYPAAAVLAAYPILIVGQRWRGASVIGAATACVVAVGLAYHDVTMSGWARNRLSEHAVAFVEEIRPIVGDDRMVFDVPNIPCNGVIPTLLGRYQGANRSPREERAEARWRVLHYRSDRRGVEAVSEPVYVSPGGEMRRIMLIELGR